MREIFIDNIIIPGKWYLITNIVETYLGELFYGKYMKLYKAPIYKLQNLQELPWNILKEDLGKVYELQEDKFYLSEITENIPELTEVYDPTPPTEIYVVMARRWGCQDAHSYICGTSFTPETAKQLALQEEYLRGGKYECEIYRTWIGSDIMIPLEP